MAEIPTIFLRMTNYRRLSCGAPVAFASAMLIDNDRLNRTTHTILSAAIEVHRTLGPGLLESIYSECLRRELATSGLRFDAERRVLVIYKNSTLDSVYRVDLVVEDLVVVEVKAVEKLLPVHSAQVLTYLRLTGCHGGLLVNFMDRG
jgi:GxxExxY protein